MLHALESILFFGVGPLLWVSGLILFLRSSLSRTKKIVWTLLLVTVGLVAGFFFSAPAIREKFAIIIVLLPLLALADAKLMPSSRGFKFWFRACGFEICTVFGVAMWCRYVLEAVRFGR